MKKKTEKKIIKTMGFYLLVMFGFYFGWGLLGLIGGYNIGYWLLFACIGILCVTKVFFSFIDVRVVKTS